MFADLLNRLTSSTSAATPEAAQDQLQLACAVLLVEVSRADWEQDARERHAMADALQRHFDLPGPTIQALLREAEQARDAEVSLHRHLRTLNDTWSPEQRAELLHSLWQVAFADGELAAYEEAAIRRLADLLYLPHADFIRSKLAADPSSDSNDR